MNEHSEQQGISTSRVKAILWKRLNATDIQVMSGEMEQRVVGGRGQPDLRLRRTQIPDEKVVEFVAGSDEAQVLEEDPVHARISQRPRVDALDEIRTDLVELKGYGASRDDISVKLQKPPYTNPRWAEAASGAVGDYIFILRLEDGTFTSGWATVGEVNDFPEMLRNSMKRSNQGVEFFEAKSVPAEIEQILAALREHHNVLLYGPPGTGKTYLMQRAVRFFTQASSATLQYSESKGAFSTDDAYVIAPGRSTRDSRWVTFHQSYTYEDFIGGRRPEPKKDTLLYLKPVDGPLLELADTANDPDGASILLVDEINRGNVSRIFGEFITLMESDKRLREDGSPDPVRTISVRLPHTGGTFQMPYHVYTLATMNSVDRSIMPLDAALRRRFHTIELRPDYQVLGRLLFGLKNVTSRSVGALPDPPTTVEDYGKLVVRLLYQINLFIQALVGADFEAGHAFFWSMEEAVKSGDTNQISSALADAWDSRVLPHLQELFRSQPHLLGAVLRIDESGKPPSYPYRRQQLPEAVVSVGGVPKIETPPLASNQDSDAVLRFIAGFEVS